jgi:hypothetical protein
MPQEQSQQALFIDFLKINKNTFSKKTCLALHFLAQLLFLNIHS